VRGGAGLLAAAIAVAVFLALWSRQTVPDPIGRGSVAPAFELPRVPETGAPIALDDLRGQVVLLNFWATWCKPCEEEMPAMQRLHEALADEGLALIAVSTDEESALVEEFVSRLGLRFPILWDPSKKTAEAYQAYRFPETLLIDREGVVVERYIGPREWDSPLYVERIRRLLAGAESLP
jgi:peroxiredoxin